jgi:hypothetical protein
VERRAGERSIPKRVTELSEWAKKDGVNPDETRHVVTGWGSHHVPREREELHQVREPS